MKGVKQGKAGPLSLRDLKFTEKLRLGFPSGRLPAAPQAGMTCSSLVREAMRRITK